MKNTSGLHNRFPRIYALLKSNGHDASKAIEILLDAVRGDSHAKKWIGAIIKTRH